MNSFMELDGEEGIYSSKFPSNRSTRCYERHRKQSPNPNVGSGSAAATWRPLPIMRLTALLPPPPTPTTFILAVSTGANEHRAVVRRGRLWSRHPLRGEARRWARPGRRTRAEAEEAAPHEAMATRSPRWWRNAGTGRSEVGAWSGDGIWTGLGFWEFGGFCCLTEFFVKFSMLLICYRMIYLGFF